MFRRQEVYQLKYQNLVNFKLNILNKAVEHRMDVKDSHVDVQLSFVEEDGELSGDKLRVDVVNKILKAAEKLNQSKGLRAFSTPRAIYNATREGQTTIIPGLKGIRSLEDNPKWASVLAKQGVCYVVLDQPQLLFDEGILSEEGRTLIKALNQSGILIIMKQAEPAQVKELLEASKNPVFLLYERLPEDDLMGFIKSEQAGIGLVLSLDSDASQFLDSLEKAVKVMGSQYVAVANDFCLWEDQGKEKMLEVISGIIKADYDRGDISNLFSSTFLRLLQNSE